jgi:hypothetical protein
MARERNNIFAVAADAVDLTLDTAGTIGSMVAGVAHLVGLGNSGPAKSEMVDGSEVNNATERMTTSLRQEAEVVKTALKAKPRTHKSVKTRSHKAEPANKPAAKARSTKSKSRTTPTKRSARIVGP